MFDNLLWTRNNLVFKSSKSNIIDSDVTIGRQKISFNLPNLSNKVDNQKAITFRNLQDFLGKLIFFTFDKNYPANFLYI